MPFEEEIRSISTVKHVLFAQNLSFHTKKRSKFSVASLK